MSILRGLAGLCVAATLAAQTQVQVPYKRVDVAPEPPKPAPAAAKPGQPPGAAGAATTTAPAQPAADQNFSGLSLEGASLASVIDLLARKLKINYVLDSRVGNKASVVLNTYGEIKDLDTRALLDTILRINGLAMIKTGDIYRIVPLLEVSHQPLKPLVNASSIPDGDQEILNLVFLKYAAVEEVKTLLTPFIGDGALMFTYPPANLLLLLDGQRNMRRTMELLALFDSDTFAASRVRLFEVSHGRPSDIARELDSIFKAIALSEKNTPIRFMPLDRINTIIAVAPTPMAFPEIEKWLAKLDVSAKITVGAIDNYVYHVKYSRAECLAPAIMELYGAFSPGGYGGYGMGGMAGGMGGYGMGMGMGMAMASSSCSGGSVGVGGGYSGPGMNQLGGSYGGGYGGGGGYGYGGYGMPMTGYGAGGYAAPMVYSAGSLPYGAAGTSPTSAAAGTGGQQDLTGQFLSGSPGGAAGGHVPRIVPNALDNSLLIQATPQEYQGILKLLKDIDVPPRQVLIEAKIYSVTLSDAWSAGVTAYLQRNGTGFASGATTGNYRQLVGNYTPAGLGISFGTLVGKTRELLATVEAQEGTSRAKVISAPSLIATDSIAASITVGQEVPTLASEAVTGAQSGGSSLFANTIANRNTGVTLNVLAHVNPSGVVTLVINQEVSAPASNSTSNIQSPSFDKKSVQTQVTCQDGDTIAIGGIINENSSITSSGLPGLNRIPFLGALFGKKEYDRGRTEMIIFMTPRVILDSNELAEASDELKGRLKKLRREVRE